MDFDILLRFLQITIGGTIAVYILAIIGVMLSWLTTRLDFFVRSGWLNNQAYVQEDIPGETKTGKIGIHLDDDEVYTFPAISLDRKPIEAGEQVRIIQYKRKKYIVDKLQ